MVESYLIIINERKFGFQWERPILFKFQLINYYSILNFNTTDCSIWIRFRSIFQPWHCRFMPSLHTHTTIPGSAMKTCTYKPTQALFSLFLECPELAFQQRGNQRDAACLSSQHWGFDSMFFSALRSHFNMKYRLWHDKSERSLEIGHSHHYNSQSVFSSQIMHNRLYVFHIL